MREIITKEWHSKEKKRTRKKKEQETNETIA